MDDSFFKMGVPSNPGEAVLNEIVKKLICKSLIQLKYNKNDFIR